MLRQYVQVRQWWHSLRIDHDLFARTGAVRPVTVKSEWSLTASSASEWELRRTMLRPSQMTPEIFLMPFERPVDDRKRRPAIVQHWLDKSLSCSASGTEVYDSLDAFGWRFVCVARHS
jgi:hypothetical protein